MLIVSVLLSDKYWSDRNNSNSFLLLKHDHIIDYPKAFHVFTETMLFDSILLSSLVKNFEEILPSLFESYLQIYL